MYSNEEVPMELEVNMDGDVYFVEYPEDGSRRRDRRAPESGLGAAADETLDRCGSAVSVIRHTIDSGSKPAETTLASERHSLSDTSAMHANRSGKNVARKSTAKSSVVALRNISREKPRDMATPNPYDRHDMSPNDGLLKQLLARYQCGTCGEQFINGEELNTHCCEEEDNMDVEIVEMNGGAAARAGPSDGHTDGGFLQELLTEEWTPTDRLLSRLVQMALFYCKRCTVHYVSPHLAAAHECSQLSHNQKWACTRCKRTLIKREQALHLRQHSTGINIKICLISRNFLDRILCQCPQCAVCFELHKFKWHFKMCGKLPTTQFPGGIMRLEGSQAKYSHYDKIKFCFEETSSFEFLSKASYEKRVSIGLFESRSGKFSLFNCSHCNVCMRRPRSVHFDKTCSPTEYTICLECGLAISVTGKRFHKTFHTKKFTLHDIDVYSIETRSLISPPMPKYFRCDKCYINFNSKFLLDHHQCGKYYVICEYCDEVFDKVLYPAHKIFHEVRPVIETPKPSPVTETPKPPVEAHATTKKVVKTSYNKRKEKSIRCLKHYSKIVVYKCLNCSCIVQWKKSIRDHKCIREENKYSCRICKQKISRILVPRHKQLHIDYSHFKFENIKIKLFESNHKIKEEPLKDKMDVIYQCAKCEVVTDSYDKIVEHSQYYLKISNTKFMSTECDQCHLNIDDDYWPRHTQQHRASDRYKVLVYHPDTLLGESWFQLFGDVPEDDVTDIVDQSLYREIRNVKMYLIKQGRNKMTIYICSACRVAVHRDDIQKHLNLKSCAKSKGTCFVCDIRFDSASFLKRHTLLHKKNYKKKDFRLVSFVKGTGMKRQHSEKTVSERNCVHGGDGETCDACKLAASLNSVNISDENELYEGVAPKDKTKQENLNLEDSRPQYNASNEKFTVYKCKDCSATVIRPRSALFHRCMRKTQQAYCDISQEYCYSQGMHYHNLKHKQNPGFVAGNFRIIMFDSQYKLKWNDDVNDGPTSKSDSSKEFTTKTVESKAKTRGRARDISPASNNSESPKYNVNENNTPTTSKISSSEDIRVKTPLILKINAKKRARDLSPALSNPELLENDENTPTKIGASDDFKMKIQLGSNVKIRRIAEDISPAPNTSDLHDYSSHDNDPSSSLSEREEFTVESKLKRRETTINTSITSHKDSLQAIRSTKAHAINTKMFNIVGRYINDLILLFKCTACDVHFVCQSSCIKHVKSHIPLAPQEYAECKFCGIQFTNKSHYLHSKRHHAEAERLEGAVVEEYYPDRDADEENITITRVSVQFLS